MAAILFRFLPVLLLLSFNHAMAFQAGEHLSITGPVNDDIYLAGGVVEVFSPVNGDAVVAGGQVRLEGEIRQDLIVAGGDIALRGAVGDDARIAGGNIHVLARIGDDMIAAGGRVHIGLKSRIGGSAWLSGGEIRLDGTVREELRAQGGRVVVSGTIEGSVKIRAGEVVILKDTVIRGDLDYHSPEPALIEEGAFIGGQLTHTPVEVPVMPLIAGVFLFNLLILVNMIIMGLILYLLFPRFALACSQTVRDELWLSLGLGLVVLVSGLLVIPLVISTGIGVVLGFTLLAVYLVMLLVGYLAGVFFITDSALRKTGSDVPGKLAYSLSYTVALLVLSLVNLIPFIGGLINLLVLLAGVGAIKRQAIKAYLSVEK